MISVKKMNEIEKGMDFGRKAEEELKRTGSDQGWQILAEGYRRTAEQLIPEAKRHQKNPDLTRDRLYKLCNKYQWFTSGSTQQYSDLFDMLDHDFTTRDLAMVIWICSDITMWTPDSIQKILDEKMYCAVLRGEIHFVSDYDEVERFLAEEAGDDPDWEICEYSGRLSQEA